MVAIGEISECGERVRFGAAGLELQLVLCVLCPIVTVCEEFALAVAMIRV